MKIAVHAFVSGRTIVRKGEAVADDDPRVSLHPDAFVDADDYLAARGGVESATARPGQVRGAKPAKKAAATPADPDA